jgi:hypothetical protein
MKVSIGDGLFIQMRVHQRPDEQAFDFYALHEIIKHNVATCLFKERKFIQLFNFTSNLFIYFRGSIDIFQLLVPFLHIET